MFGNAHARRDARVLKRKKPVRKTLALGLLLVLCRLNPSEQQKYSRGFEVVNQPIAEVPQLSSDQRVSCSSTVRPAADARRDSSA
jgi:hypothetical protein